MKPYIKEAMVEALIKLSDTKPIRKITINDITSECGVSKQTFYNHFKDKNDLISFSFSAEADRITKEALRYNFDYRTSILNLYTSSVGRKGFYCAAVRGKETKRELFDCIANCSREYFKARITSNFGTKVITPDISLAIEFNCYGNAHLFIKWVEGGMKDAPESPASVNFKCIPEPLKEYFFIT